MKTREQIGKEIRELRERFDRGEITEAEYLVLREPLKYEMAKALFSH